VGFIGAIWSWLTLATRPLHMGFVWAELKALAQDRHEAHRRPAVEELGALDLGPFADRDFVSPVMAAQARKAMRSGTTDRDDVAADDGGMAEAATATR
jgi:hypothetical protein